ncbi:MAG: hypothetical protein ACI4UE_02750 [Candidatus Scatovivens sp.]
MKFSQKKKAKMCKIRQRRINRVCKDMIGCCIDYVNNYEVEDQANINDTVYLLARVSDNEYAIFKIVKPFEYVRLSEKRVLQNQKDFSNHFNWKNHSTIEIADDGKIKSVRKTVRIMNIKNQKAIYTWVTRN